MARADRQRTAAEREAARLERERRRAARRGEPASSEIASGHEEVAPLEGEALSDRVEVGSEEGEASSDREEVAPLEGEVSSDRAEVPSLEGDGPADREEASSPQLAEALPAVAVAVAEQLPPADGATRLPSPSRAVRRPRRPAIQRLHRPRRREGHSLRTRAAAVGALVAVALVVWGAVMLIHRLRRSGAGQVSRPPVAKVVIPEGETRTQIAAIARKAGLHGDYLRATVHNPGLEPKRFGAPAKTRSLEGFLFPATYEVRAHGSVEELVADQLEAFHERFGPEEERRAKALGLTPYQLLIVASMVEREALLPHDRPLVAAVIYNRLRAGMPLGIDATIRFALNNFEKPLTEAQLHTPSPYNTRLHPGLPPTPISNPGIESIEAAAHPAKAAYLYYVDGPDGCGELVFADTEAEFEHDKAAYDEALQAHGGHLPACRRK